MCSRYGHQTVELVGYVEKKIVCGLVERLIETEYEFGNSQMQMITATDSVIIQYPTGGDIAAISYCTYLSSRWRNSSQSFPFII